MGALAIVQIIIGLAQGVLAGLTTANAPQEVIAAVQAGIESFKKVHGTLVTKAQVDASMFEYKW